MPRNVFKDTDYVGKLSDEDRKWLFKALIATEGSLSRKFLNQLADEVTAEKVFRSCIKARSAKRKDIYAHAKKYEPNFEGDIEIGHLISEGVNHMSLEDAIIDAIDAVKVKPSFNTYGGNAPQLSVGDRIVVAVEGHALQNRIGLVTGTRRSQYLVEVETGKGKVTAYFSTRELLKI